MKVLVRILMAAMLLPAVALAQEWQAYTNTESGFSIDFPSAPVVQKSSTKDQFGAKLPLTRYTVRQAAMVYSVSVIDYTSTNADPLTVITETEHALRTSGEITATTGVRIGRYHGRAVNLSGSDGSRSAVTIFFLNKHLYTVVGQALPPNAAAGADDATRFQESLQFPDENGGFGRFFGGGSDRPRPPRAASVPVAPPAPASPAVGAAPAAPPRVSNDPHTDAACAGKATGDRVQLNTADGKVEAICTLVARPVSPAQ